MVDRLSERLDWPQRFVPPRALPVLPQLALMGTRPLDHESSSSGRKLAGDDLEALNVHRGLVVAIGGMEVRPTEMVGLVVIHPDHDPDASSHAEALAVPPLSKSRAGIDARGCCADRRS
jgi:hypothetical protein